MKEIRCFVKTLTTIAGLLLIVTSLDVMAEDKGYEQARWNEIHFKPNIDKATDKQCLACHQDVLERKSLNKTPAGLDSKDTLAWYQTLNTYAGEQETFHRRHLVTPLAKRLMDMRCTTCHQGSDPRGEAPNPPSTHNSDFTLRKSVNPETCLMCHAQFNYKVMALPGPWQEVGETVGNNCLTCHAVIRTNRHKVNFLKTDVIEKAGAESADACFGCHGGRAWYRKHYPYPRHAWDGMAKEVPEWATQRATESDKRFLQKHIKASKK